MARAGNISPLGLYEWDDTLFDLMQIPEELDKTILVNNLLAETAELEVLYPNPVVLKNLIGVWSYKQLDIWNRLYATTQYEYDPIENYNRMETGSDSGTDNTTHSGADGRTETIRDGGTQGETSSSTVSDSGTDTATGTDTKGGWIAGFDSVASGTDDGLVKKTRDQDDSSSSMIYGKTETGSGSKTTTFGKTESITESKTYGSSVANTKSGTHNIHAHGNIGVTTTQKLIREQRQVEKFNLYDIIIEDFKMRFCIMVY